MLETQKLELLKHARYVPLRLEPEPAPAAPEVTLTTGVVALHEDCVYCGQLLAGVPQGEGRLLCPSAREVVYEGGFADGVFEGEGRRFFENEETERGVFHAGLLVRGRRIHADGSIFVGEFTGWRAVWTGSVRVAVGCVHRGPVGEGQAEGRGEGEGADAGEGDHVRPGAPGRGHGDHAAILRELLAVQGQPLCQRDGANLPVLLQRGCVVGTTSTRRSPQAGSTSASRATST